MACCMRPYIAFYGDFIRMAWISARRKIISELASLQSQRNALWWRYSHFRRCSIFTAYINIIYWYHLKFLSFLKIYLCIGSFFRFSWILTHIKDNANRSEGHKKYNFVHAYTRQTIEWVCSKKNEENKEFFWEYWTRRYTDSYNGSLYTSQHVHIGEFCTAINFQTCKLVQSL